MGQTYSMLFPPGKPPLTEKNLTDLTNKVYLITGANSGLGLELASLLYSHNATVWLAARSPSALSTALSTLRTRSPTSTGTLHSLHLDLSDLSTLKPATTTFLATSPRLDVLFLNAGVMVPPADSTTAQGHDLQLGVNALAHHALAHLLSPLLISTASSSPPNTVRAVWVSSSAAYLLSPAPNLLLANLDYAEPKSAWHRYGVSKAGVVFLASEFGKRHKGDGIVSLSMDPGGLKTGLQRHVPKWQMLLLGWLLREPRWGAYTELWAGLGEGVTVERNGGFVAPWGHFDLVLRKDLVEGMRGKEEGGEGAAEEFWEWCEERVKEFV